MTKKSLGRQQRDAAQARAKEGEKQVLTSGIWDDVLTLSWRCRQMLQSHAGLTTLAKCPELLDLVEDKRTLGQNITILVRDLQQMQIELNGLYDKHSGLSGNPKDVDDGALAIDIHEKYLVWDQKHNSVVVPIATHILEQLSVAERELEKQNPERARQLKEEVSAAMQGVLGGRQMVSTRNITPEQDPSVVTDAVIKG